MPNLSKKKNESSRFEKPTPYFVIYRQIIHGRKSVFYYNKFMEKITSILIGLGLLFGVYFFGMRKWDYTSQAKQTAEKERLQQAGLATCYYFIPVWRLALFNILSGGLFSFYWALKQWQAIKAGYKNTENTPLAFSPWLRTLFLFLSFYQLTAIINRTCRYMRKPTAFAAAFWGTAFWAGFAAAWTHVLAAPWRLAGAALFMAAPCILQRHVNNLPKNLPPTKIKLPEIVWLGACWLLWAAIGVAVKHYGIL